MSVTSFLPRHGSYRRLRVYRVVEVVYDLTYHFAHTYLSKSDRTIDQMIQAARSGKQNIAEGNAASTTSAETEIKLTNVAKASLEELLLDYEDYLRVRKRVLWTKSHPRYESMRNYARSPQLLEEYSSLMIRLTDEELANLCITLIHQANYMLYRLLESLQKRFIEQGGIREQMTAVRKQYRSNQNNQSCQSNQKTQ
ncbi:four helix bundle suffix domain-containing protein [Porphyromonas gulae]|uniref:four helix bundle suffix domain-containing protein n=1 Tax=Porphyromonas gulae TaxID=111105 RepID=UPI00052B9594|nr:four helix bundle suffix domain-containing protein [Porphyromonas gulae]KGN91413.1 hypothetical protein HQ46_01700 [Porphyromonas gulae]